MIRSASCWRRPDEEGVAIEWVLETHIHADHLSGAPLIKARTGAKIAIGEHVREVQTIFRPIFGADDVKAEGGDFDRLLKDGERIEVGGLAIEVIHTPGHTPGLRQLPDRRRGVRRRYLVHARLWHRADRFSGRHARGSCTARSASCCRCRRKPGCSCAMIIRRRAATSSPGRRRSREERPGNRMSMTGSARMNSSPCGEERDKRLCTPRLLIPSIQVNMRAGRFPPADEHGVRYLRVPVTPQGRHQPRTTSASALRRSRLHPPQSAMKMTSSHRQRLTNARQTV